MSRRAYCVRKKGPRFLWAPDITEVFLFYSSLEAASASRLRSVLVNVMWP